MQKTTNRSFWLKVAAFAVALFASMLLVSSITVFANESFGGWVVPQNQDTVIDFNFTLTSGSNYLVASVFSVVRNEYRMVLERFDDGWAPVPGVHPVYTWHNPMGSDQAHVLRGPFEPGTYRLRLTIQRFRSPLGHSIKVHSTNSLVTNYANDDSFQSLGGPWQFTSSTTIWIHNITGSGNSWRLNFSVVQRHQSMLTGEMYYIRINNFINSTHTRREFAEAHLQQWLDNIGFRAFPNVVIRHTFSFWACFLSVYGAWESHNDSHAPYLFSRKGLKYEFNK